jgi:hypothetical protein
MLESDQLEEPDYDRIL